MKRNLVFLFVCFALQITQSCAQSIPTVYSEEHTGKNYKRPILPELEQLPVIEPLTNPFQFSDGNSEVMNFDDWSKRRAEIHEEIEHYEIGQKPPRPQSITANFTADTLLTISIIHNDKKLDLTSKISLPTTKGPHPIIIGIGWETGSLPKELFKERDIATVTFDFSQVMSHTQTRGEEPINEIYPELEHIGAYSAWSWGVSRIIDGLEQIAIDANLDLSHIGITGCSFAGKMALFAGAFDERIALTIAQEPGGGGAAAWRVSETLGNVETLGRTSHAWFMEEMFKFSNHVDKLPFDHHELMSMVAPRALLILGNPDFEWLADESGYVSCVAAHQVWKRFGIEDRFGYSIVDGHGHCQLPDIQKPEVEAFIDKFLLGKTNVNTDVKVHPFEMVDTDKWYKWWESGRPNKIHEDLTDKTFLYYELECGDYGDDWNVLRNINASGDEYITVIEGKNNTENPSTKQEALLKLNINVPKDGNYKLFGRVNLPSSSDDSFYIKVDTGEFDTINNSTTNGWEWINIKSMTLTKGAHEISITYREDGALLDKLCITDYHKGPTDNIDISLSENSCN